MAGELLDVPGEGTDLALPGDMIRKRHIATRAGNRREVVVLVVGDNEFVGYSIGLDEQSLQLVELFKDDGGDSEVSTIALEYIVSISDGKPFSKLTMEQRDIVDRRTFSFRKTAQAWLATNWPKLYGNRNSNYQNRQGAAIPSRRPLNGSESQEQEGSDSDADS